MNNASISTRTRQNPENSNRAISRLTLITLCKLTAIIIVIGLLTSCGKKNVKPQPTIIAAQVIVSPGVNPDASNRPSPIVLRIYELKALGKFKAADFFGLMSDDAAMLGKDLLHREELHLAPGVKQPYHRKVPPETEHIGIIAAYRNINEAVWKVMAPVPANKTSVFTISVNDLALSIQSQ